jgi:hypothetical protein
MKRSVSTNMFPTYYCDIQTGTEREAVLPVGPPRFVSPCLLIATENITLLIPNLVGELRCLTASVKFAPTVTLPPAAPVQKTPRRRRGHAMPAGRRLPSCCRIQVASLRVVDLAGDRCRRLRRRANSQQEELIVDVHASELSAQQ